MDESILNLSDRKKAEMRISVTAVGFLLLGMYWLFGAYSFCSEVPLDRNTNVHMLIAITGLILGTILALLHKRDLIAMLFIIFSLENIILSLQIGVGMTLPIAIVGFVLAFAAILSRNEQMVPVSLILVLDSLLNIAIFTVNDSPYIVPTLLTILAVCCLYFALAAGSERVKLPMADILRADETDETKDGQPVHFKIIGSTLGFVLITYYSLTCILNNYGIIDIQNYFWLIDTVVAVLFIIVSLIMMVAGRMSGTPMAFMALAIIHITKAAGFIPIVGIVGCVVIGILLLLRYDSRILFAVVMFLTAIAFFISDNMMGEVFGRIPSATLYIVSFVITAYIILALNSNGRLKLI